MIFILRALIEQLTSSGQRKISIADLNMKKRIVYDSEIAGFAAMGTRQVTNHVKLASVLQTMRRQIVAKEKFTCSGLLVIRSFLVTKWPTDWHSWFRKARASVPIGRSMHSGRLKGQQQKSAPRSRNRSSHPCSILDGQDFVMS